MTQKEFIKKIGLPFDDDNLQELFKKITKGEFTFPEDFPPGAKDLVSRMLTVDVKKRITIPEIKQHPWFLVYIYFSSTLMK